MSIRRRASALFAAGLLTMGVAACGDDDDTQLDEDVDDVTDEIEDGVDNLGDEIDEELDDLGDQIDEELDDADAGDEAPAEE